jgi:hypothetical protein
VKKITYIIAGLFCLLTFGAIAQQTSDKDKTAQEWGFTVQGDKVSGIVLNAGKDKIQVEGDSHGMPITVESNEHKQFTVEVTETPKAIKYFVNQNRQPNDFCLIYFKKAILLGQRYIFIDFSGNHELKNCAANSGGLVKIALDKQA